MTLAHLVAFLALCAPGASEFPSDTAYAAKMESGARALWDKGGLKRMRAFASQLGRPSVALSLPAPETASLPLPDLFQRRRPGVLVLGAYGICKNCSEWHEVSNGTAFVLTDDGVCVTNHHLFEEQGKETTLFAFTDDGAAYPVLEVLAANEKDDVAIFRIGAKGLKPIPLRPTAPVGTSLALISHPGSTYYMLSQGMLARRAKMPDLVEDEEVDTILVSTEYAVGSSGGPIMDMSGNAVGMVRATRGIGADPSDEMRLQMVLRMSVPAESILKLIRKP